MLNLENVQTSYGTSQVLHGVTLEVPANKIVALLGRNGMGKSTTVHSIIGFVPPLGGQITFQGTRLNALSPNQIAGLGIALVPQGRRIFPSLTVRENLTLGMRRRSTRKTWSLKEMYGLFPILEARANVSGTALSGGEQQMLSVARALMTAPDLILMDEPSEGLAPLLVEHLGSIMQQLRAAGLSILLVEQNLSLALSVTDYVYVLSRGVVVYGATPNEINANEEIKTRYLGASV